MHRLTTQSIAAGTGLMGVTAVFAHDGHGLAGIHWHATDTLGFVAVSALVAMAIWLSRK